MKYVFDTEPIIYLHELETHPFGIPTHIRIHKGVRMLTRTRTVRTRKQTVWYKAE